MPPGVLVKAFPSAKHIPQKMFHWFYRGSNPAGLLKFHKMHDLLGFEPSQKLTICIFRQNPVLVELRTGCLCMQKIDNANIFVPEDQ